MSNLDTNLQILLSTMRGNDGAGVVDRRHGYGLPSSRANKKKKAKRKARQKAQRRNR